MKINKYLNAVLFGAALFAGTSCADFEEYNTDPYGIADSQVALGDLFNEAQLSIYYNQSNGNWEYQLIQNLNADLFSGYMAPPSGFNGGIYNDNYFMMEGWNNYTLNYMLLHVIKPTTSILKNENLADDFSAIAKIMKVAGAHKMVDTYGPSPYLEAMQGGTSVTYNSEEECYKAFLSELKEASEQLTSWLDANGGAPNKERLTWDKMCGQSQVTWLQFANTLRLRLAMRCAMVDPALAKQNAEEACANKYGLLTTVDVMVKDANTRNPLGVIARDYNDCAISANYETILKGFNDPRLEATVLPVGWGGKNDIVAEDGSAAGMLGEIKGVRNGHVDDGSSWKSYSIPYFPAEGGPYSTDVPMPVMNRAEAFFLQAEGKLRGWNVGSGTVQQYYEDGVRASFASVKEQSAKWTTAAAMENADVETYLQGTTTQIAYVDPHASVNNIAPVNTLPVKFNAGGSKEEQLEQIMTQKWIANFPEGLNAWAEYRRTGYPHLFPIPSSNCNVQSQYLGGDAASLVKMGIRRLPFTNDEKSANPKGYQRGVEILSARGQKDVIDARLWWDTGKNF